MKSYITTYPNPDTDGVTSVVCFAEYLKLTRGENAVPVVGGATDAETQYVFETFGVALPKMVPNCLEGTRVYLVDTHHTAQLKGFVNFDAVVEILDHHPNGNPEAFPNALVVNEKIGAVATLLAERFISENLTLPPAYAMLLYGGIISNTLNFTAPTTTERDRQAANWLASLAALPADLPDKMLEARSLVTMKPTWDVLNADCKVFEMSGNQVAISQIEGVNVITIMQRPDLHEALERLAEERKTEWVLVSAVDVRLQCTFVAARTPKIEGILAELLQLHFEHGYARCGRILLRKSDLVPAMNQYFICCQTHRQ